MTRPSTKPCRWSPAPPTIYGDGGHDPKPRVRIALVVMMVALRDTENIVIALDDEQER